MEKVTEPENAQAVAPQQLHELVASTGLDLAVIDKWAQMIRDNQLVVFGVMSDGIYVGRCNLWLAPADEEVIRVNFPNIPLVNALQINEDQRKRGFASLLMDEIEQEAAMRGFTAIGLGVEPDNDKAVALYQKRGYGFVDIGESDTYQTGWFETEPDGSVKWVEVPVKFMVKYLA